MNPKRKKFTKGNIGHLFEKLGHKTDTKDIYESSTQQQSINTQNEITKDFHNAKLFQVKNWLFSEMLGYVESGYSDFVIIHGHNRGVVIRTYLRNDFQREFGKKFTNLKIEIVAKEKGVTEIRLKS